MLKYGETHTKADHTDVIFQDLKILKFYDLVKLKICEVMYRAFNSIFVLKKTLFDVEYYGQINIINLLNDDYNLKGFSFKHL